MPGGDTGRVTWALRLAGKQAAAASALSAQFIYTVIGQVIPDATATPITAGAGSFFTPNSAPFTGDNSSPAVINGCSVWRAAFALSVDWPSGTYDRYIEFEDTSFFTSGQPATWRVLGTGDGDGLQQTVSGLALGNPSAPQPIAFNAHQSSGGPLTIQRTFIGYELPL